MTFRSFDIISVWLVVTLSTLNSYLSTSATACPIACGCLGNVISCENLDLRKIHWNSFPSWTESLSLRQIRGFRHLSTSAVQSLTRLDGLKHLNITSCQEKLELDGDWLRHLPSLEVLKVSQCGLEETPVFKTPHPNIKSLILNRNKIERIRVHTFDSLPKLIRLEVNFNNLKELKKDWFRKNHPLEVLSANRNSIKRLDPLLNDTLTGLRELRLNKNRLCRLSSRHFRRSLTSNPEVPNLTKIPVKHSGGGLPLPLGQPSESAKLPLNSGVRISRKRRSAGEDECDGVNSELPNMPLVHTLELSRNKISSIRTLTFNSWKSLKVLRLKRNDLKNGSLDPGAFYIDKGGLTILDLTANQRLGLVNKAWLYANGGSSLKELILAKCGLQNVLPVGLFTDHHTKLKRLDLSGNKLVRLKVGQFKELNQLEELNLGGNRFTGFPAGVFKGLNKLRKLSLDGNRITSLSPQEASSFPRSMMSSSTLSSLFQPLSNLLELDLSKNRLTRLDRNDFQGLSHLQLLNLNRNNLTRFSSPESHCPKLQQLLMDSGHFTCDCSAAPLFRWLHQQLPSASAKTITANCSQPVRFAGKPLMSLSIDQLGRCGPQTYLEPTVRYHGNSSVWVLRGGNLTLRCEVFVAGDPSSWSSERLKEVRPKVIWEQIDSDSGKRRTIIGRPTLPSETKFKVVDLIAIQRQPGSKQGNARWLSLLRIQPGDYEENLGGFQCRADNSYGHDSSPLVQVAVYELPRFTDRPQSVVSTVAGSVVQIPCSAIGTPSPAPALRKHGAIDFPAARDRRLSIYDGDTCFTIANVQKKDAGEYVCESVNAAGKVSFHFRLEVNVIPFFEKKPRSKAVFTVGQSAVLSCMAKGWPFPTITWTKNGRSLHLPSAPLVNSSSLQLAERGQLLLFLSVAPQHAAEYECTLLNVVGKESAKIVVDVRTASGLVYSGSQSRDEEEMKNGRRGGKLSGHMTGIVVIAVVVCVVATSLAWVAALCCFRWRKRAAAAAAASSVASGCPQTPSSTLLLARSVSSNSEIFMTSRAALRGNYHLGMDEEDMVETAAAARYLLEKHRMLRRDATLAYDGEETEDSSGAPQRQEGAPTSDYNTGTSSECSAHSGTLSSPCPGHEPVSTSSPLAYLPLPPSGIPTVTSFGVVLHETDEYV